MLKDRGEPVAPWQRSVKYAHGAWNCGAPNRAVNKHVLYCLVTYCMRIYTTVFYL